MGTPLSVLLVEDSEDDAALLVRELQRGGYDPVVRRVDTAASMSAALDQETWDIILSDYSLPHFSAPAALSLCRERGLDRPFIIVSGTVGEETAVASMKAGAHDYLIKGNLTRLVPAIQRELREAEGRRARRKAEEALRHSEARKGAILEAALDCIITIDYEGKIIEFNPAAEKTFGYTRGEVLGREMAELIIPPSWRERHRRGLAHYLATGEGPVLGKRLEMPAMRADRTEFPIELAVSRINFAGSPLFTAYVRDITERKRSEETLQALYRASLQIQEPLTIQERLDRLFQAAQTLLGVDRLNILIADREGRWLEGTASLGSEDATGAVRVPIGPEGGGLAKAYLTQQAIQWTGQAPVPEELRLKPPYDRIAALRARVFAIVPLVVQGRAIGVLGAGWKDSRLPQKEATLGLLQLFAAQAALAIEQARLYEDLRGAALQLEARVEDRTRALQAANVELEAARRQAEEASRHKSDFLANMSHELRTPLNAVIGFSEVLQQQTVGPLNAKQTRYTGHIHQSGKHLLQLINDILDLSKVEAGKVILEPQALPVATTLEDILVIARGLAHKKAQTLEAEVAPDLPPLRADPVRFKQICFNLLSNAVKFTPEQGRITLVARRAPDASEWLELRVTDTGMGIEAEDLPRLFQEFVQLEAAATKRHEGTGLGLALTKRLVELHGGRIRAESRGEGHGTTFTVILPFTGPAVAAEASTQPACPSETDAIHRRERV